MTQNERSYIKQFGRVANSTHQPQLNEVRVNDEVIGQVETAWNELGSFWVFTGVIFTKEGAMRLDHETFDTAHQWVETKHLEFRRHNSFGVYLEYMLKDMSMSKTQLAHHINVSRQTIHDYLNDSYPPSAVNFIKMARVYAKWSSSDVNTILLDMSDSIV